MFFFACLITFLCFVSVVAYADFWRQVLNISQKRHTPVLPYLSNIPSLINQDVAVKNFSFEKYIVKKFNKEQFNCFYWRGDAHTDELLPMMNAYPNMEFDFSDELGTVSIALICRWNGQFANNEIEWSTHDLINRYKEYERETKRTVFVIFGIGGTPEAPEELFMAPLSKIPRHAEKISREFLILYKKADVNTAFSLNKQSMRLS